MDRWVTVHERYEEVRETRIKNWPCPGCGRKVKRQRTFVNTINPFNRNADGVPKSRREVTADVRAKGDAWAAVPERHTECEAAFRAAQA